MPLDDETEYDKKLGEEYIHSQLEKSYFEYERSSSEGPRMVNSILRVRENIYSVAYIYLLKRIHIEGDPSSDEERNDLDDNLKGAEEGKDK